MYMYNNVYIYIYIYIYGGSGSDRIRSFDLVNVVRKQQGYPKITLEEAEDMNVIS